MDRKRSHRSLASLVPLLVGALTASARGQSQLLENYGVLPGDSRGYAVAGGADLDQDGYDDFVVGSPFEDAGGKTDNGTVRVVSGRDGSLLKTRSGVDHHDHFGFAVSFAGDVDGDGWEDIAIGAPNASNGSIRPGMAGVISGRNFKILHSFWGDADLDEFGYSVAGIDWDSDGLADIAVGAPNGQFGLAGGRFGGVRVLAGANGAVLKEGWGLLDSRYGTALAGGADLDGDGRAELAVGAPGLQGGLVYALNPVTSLSSLILSTGAAGDEYGAALASGFDANADGHMDLLVGAPGYGSGKGLAALFDGQSSTLIRYWYGGTGDRFGSSVSFIEDLDGDNLPEVLVGCPEPGVGPGFVRVHGPTKGTPLYTLFGQPGSEFGHSVACAGDVNDDGYPDFLVGAPEAASPQLATPVGLARVYSASGPGIVTYCTAGTSASGCRAALIAFGTPSATAQNGFFLSATDVEGNNTGLFYFGANGRQASPWGNGTSFQCVTPPLKRGGVLQKTGTNGQCDGAFQQDLNALWCSSCPKPNFNFGSGTAVQAQLWYRDPANTSNQTTSLSNAVEFSVGP